MYAERVIMSPPENKEDTIMNPPANNMNKSVLYAFINGLFYYFLRKFCVIPFQHDPATFDRIPFKSRIHLALLLDRWKAAVDRRNNIARYSALYATPIPDEQERKTFFEVVLKKFYEEAAQRRKISEMSGIFTPPEPDLEYWERFVENSMYRARIAAGEPVFFANEHCCIDNKLWYNYSLRPGAYPGLQYYELFLVPTSIEKQFYTDLIRPCLKNEDR